MQWTIRRATATDVADIVSIMEQSARTIAHPHWFVTDDAAYIQSHLTQNGETWVAQSPKESISAFLIVHIPGLSQENLGRTLHFCDAQCMQVAHMESIAVHPDARGQGLQKQLLERAEASMRAQRYMHLMATVHPDNRYSLHNFLQCGYQVVDTVRKYGGLPRHILHKCLAPMGG